MSTNGFYVVTKENEDGEAYTELYYGDEETPRAFSWGDCDVKEMLADHFQPEQKSEMSTKPKPQGEGARPLVWTISSAKNQAKDLDRIVRILVTHAQLLEALKLAHSGLDFSIITTDQLEQIEAAIAAATGGKG